MCCREQISDKVCDKCFVAAFNGNARLVATYFIEGTIRSTVGTFLLRAIIRVTYS